MTTTILKRISFTTLVTFLFLIISSLNTATAQYGLANVENDTLTKSVLIHPVIETNDSELIFSREHTYKDHLGLGDQLARDFIVITVTEDGIMKAFKNDGKENKNYIGWRKNVLAPVSGTIKKVNHPTSTNKPGIMDREAPTGYILFEHENGTTIVYAHVREIEVTKGQKVIAGEVVAKVGNNGNSTGPHIHVGAWKEDTPLQIQVDLYAGHRH